MSKTDIISDTSKKRAVFEVLKDMPVIRELRIKPRARYEVTTREARFYPLIDEHQVIVVAGSFFGDEGKGKIVDAVARHPDMRMVMRSNGGQNAGHTVVIDGVKHVLHIIPSGVFVAETISYIGSECVFDPVSFVTKELQTLIDGGIEYKERLFVGNAHIVTPYHKVMDLARNFDNLTRGSDLSKLRLNDASTLQGIAPVHKSKAGKEGPRLYDLLGDPEHLKTILEKDLLNYYGMLKARKISESVLLRVAKMLNKGTVRRMPKHIIDFLSAKDKIAYLMELFDTYVRNNPDFPCVKDVSFEVQRRLAQGEKLLLEGSQSYWLSNKISQTWCQSTSADTTMAGIISAANIKADKPLRINIHKAPGSSRVGRGPNPAGHVQQSFFSTRGWYTLEHFKDRCTDLEKIQRQFWKSITKNGLLEPTVYEDESGTYTINVAMAMAEARAYGECGATTKKPRSMSLFDCVAHAAVMRAQGPYTSISAVDRGDNLSYVGLVVAYIYYNPEQKGEFLGYVNGQIIRPYDAYPPYAILEHCYPIIKKVKGWQHEPIAHDTWHEGRKLPQGVQDFIAAVEYYTGAEVIAIGNGPEAEHIIYVRRLA